MPNYLRPLTQTLTLAEIEAANRVLAAHGLETHSDKPKLLDVLMAISPCDTDRFIDIATEIREALDALEDGDGN